MTFEDIKEIVTLHDKLIKNKKVNKEVLTFLEKCIRNETNISINDIKILLEVVDKIKTEHLKITLKSIIEGKPFEKYVYLPTQPEIKPFDPKPYWDSPIICSSFFKDHPYSVNSTTTTEPVEEMKDKKGKEGFCGE